MSEDGLSGLLIETMPDYDVAFHMANNSIMFRGKSFVEWAAEIALPELKNDVSLDELELYNLDFIRQSEAIISNLSFARSARDMSKIQYVRSLVRIKNGILEERSEAGVRAPSLDVLDIMAKNKAIDEYSLYQISDLIFEFWQTMFEKIKQVSFRLSNMNSLRNVESKYAAH